METIEKFTKDIAYISKLNDAPNSDDGLTADALKARFDQAGQDIQSWLNGLVDSINSNNTELVETASGDKTELSNLIQTNTDNLDSLVERFTCTVDASWSGSGPYVQEISVPGILETDKPIVDIVPSTDFITAKAELDAFALIYRIVTSVDMITVYATEATANAFDIQMVCIREPESSD